MRKTAITGILILALGCVPAGPEQGSSSPLRTDESGYVIVALFQMSDNYADMMGKGGKGWAMMIKILDRYFRDRVASGTSDKLIIGQLSAKGTQTMIWEGTPLQFREAFATPEAFRELLVSNSNPSGSRIYDGIREGLNKLINYPGVAEGKVKTALFAATNLIDNQSDNSGRAGHKSLNFLLGSLHTYARLNGSVALLFVEDNVVEHWNHTLAGHGFKPGHFTVQSKIVQEPTIPDFSDQ